MNEELRRLLKGEEVVKDTFAQFILQKRDWIPLLGKFPLLKKQTTGKTKEKDDPQEKIKTEKIAPKYSGWNIYIYIYSGEKRGKQGW